MRTEAWPATILVVEDDAVLAQVLCRVLTRDGHSLLHASNASEALDMASECLPQLILLDAGLREGTGLKLAETFRSRYASLPVILLTTYPLSELDMPGWAGRLLTKSIDLSDLRRTVASALAEETAHPATGAKSAFD